MKNKSKAYGCYGGVSQQNHYVPPGAPGFVPRKEYPLAFTDEQKVALLYLAEKAPDVLVRTLTDSKPGNIETFVLSTSSKPEDKIIYISEQDQVVLDDLAGSGLANTTENPLDGGTF
jgi:hypothetical protein